MDQSTQTPPPASSPPAGHKKASAWRWWLIGMVTVIGAVVIWLAQSRPGGSNQPAVTTEGNVVRYTGADGYVPKNLQIQAGQTVTWKNASNQAITVDSNPHPIHTSYPDLNLGQIGAGQEQTLTFPTAGIYNYHNHLRSSHQATVTVQ